MDCSRAPGAADAHVLCHPMSVRHVTSCIVCYCYFYANQHHNYLPRFMYQLFIKHPLLCSVPLRRGRTKAKHTKRTYFALLCWHHELAPWAGLLWCGLLCVGCRVFTGWPPAHSR